MKSEYTGRNKGADCGNPYLLLLFQQEVDFFDLLQYNEDIIV